MNTRWLIITIILCTLNALDCSLTCLVLSHNIATEANPFMAWLWAIDPVVFITVKLLMPAVCIFIGCQCRSKLFAIFVVVLMSFICTHSLIGWFLV